MLEIEEARKRQQAAMDAAVAKFKEEQKLVSQIIFTMKIFVFQILIMKKEQKKSEEKVEDYERLLDGKSKLVKVFLIFIKFLFLYLKKYF
jgi:hypothetical protein